MRKMRDQGRIKGIDSDIWDENDDAVIAPNIAKCVDRIYPETIRGEQKWLWFLQTDPAPPPNR
jgi:hypothetical protein